MPFTPKFVDLVRNFTTVQGTSAAALGAAVSGYTGIAEALSAGDQFYYCIQSLDKPQEREVGRGTLNANGTVARQPVAGGPVSFTGGTKTIALVAAAEWFARLDAMSGGSLLAATCAELAAASTAGGQAVLRQAGREGLFVFNGANLAAKVAADPAQGVHVAPATDPTGASGAWVRQFGGSANVRWFGATGDGATNDGPAFAAAIAYLKATGVNADVFYRGSTKLLVPAGHYFLGTTTLDIGHTIVIEGEGSGLAGGRTSRLRWAAGASGIRIQRYNTSGADQLVAPGQNGGDGTIIRGLNLAGGYAGSEGEYHGIHAKARFVAEDCLIENFQGDGVHSHAVAGSGTANEGNANNCALSRLRITGCRDGLFVDGADTNVWLGTAIDVSGNRRWGLHDSSFLGNSYLACHAADNGLVTGAPPSVVSHGGNRYAVKGGQEAAASVNAPSGSAADTTHWYYVSAGGPNEPLNMPAWTSGMSLRAGGAFRTDNANAANLLLGCYSEGGQGPAQLSHPTLAVGGLHGSGLEGTGLQLMNYFGALSAPKIATSDTSNGNATAITPGVLEYSHPSHGQFTLEWMGNDLAYTALRSGVPSNWAFRLTGENSTAAVGKRRLDFPNGFGLADKKVLSGTAAPSSGTFVQGDMVFNAAPAAGGPPGWMCVAGGSPGTWKAMANLAA